MHFMKFKTITHMYEIFHRAEGELDNFLDLNDCDRSDSTMEVVNSESSLARRCLSCPQVASFAKYEEKF